MKSPKNLKILSGFSTMPLEVGERNMGGAQQNFPFRIPPQDLNGNGLSLSKDTPICLKWAAMCVWQLDELDRSIHTFIKQVEHFY